MRPARRLRVAPRRLRVAAVRQVVVAMSVVDDAELAPAGAALTARARPRRWRRGSRRRPLDRAPPDRRRAGSPPSRRPSADDPPSRLSCAAAHLSLARQRQAPYAPSTSASAARPKTRTLRRGRAAAPGSARGVTFASGRASPRADRASVRLFLGARLRSEPRRAMTAHLTASVVVARSTRRTRSAAIRSTVCVAPSGHFTSSDSTVPASPRPKWARGSFAEQ